MEDVFCFPINEYSVNSAESLRHLPAFDSCYQTYLGSLLKQLFGGDSRSGIFAIHKILAGMLSENESENMVCLCMKGKLFVLNLPYVALSQKFVEYF